MAVSLQKRLVVLTVFILATLASAAMSRALTEDVVTTTFQQWIAEHGRSYQDELEKAKRFKIFKANMEHIENFNSQGNRTYKIGLNKFADVSEDEFSAMYTGFKMSNTNTLSSGNQSKFYDVQDYQDAIPDSIDWRQNGAVTSVKNQGQCGCCWAISSVAAVEGLFRNGVSLSTQQLLDCVTTNYGCGGGWMNNAFEYIIQNQGITSENNYPYMSQQRYCQGRNMRASAWISGYVNVPNNEQDLKAAVARQPVSVVITTCQNFILYTGGVFQEDCGTRLNHAVAIVGYGTTTEGEKYWLIKNSWGERWGENGYMRLQRDVPSPTALCGITIYASYPVLQRN